MITIVKKEDCCGCTACYNICPKDAIKMEPDNEGFLYPTVDVELCIECGLCEKVCPIKNKKCLAEEKTDGYIVRNLDEDIVKDSTSGGAFTVFAKYIFDNNGVVYGAGYDSEMNVVCKKATNMAEVAEMRGSKFVQSSLGNTFSEIKELLKEGILVLFTGTPCQVGGLLAFLNYKPSNLLCIDFVCRGVPSPGLWRNYVEMMESKYNCDTVSAVVQMS